jgi:hypothetical protein
MAILAATCSPVFAHPALLSAPPAESVCKSCAAPDAVPAPNPPPSFDPLTASDAALAHYGFPPRPDETTAPAAYASWKKVMTLHVRRITPVFQATTIANRPAMLSSTPKGGGKGATGSSSGNWSGYAIVNSNNPFMATNTTIYGSFVIPVAQQAFGTCTNTLDYSSQWVGIDGYGSPDVFQAGVEADAKCSGSYYSAWYEWYPNNESRIGNFAVTAGDLIYLYIWNTSLTQGNYYIVNVTANTSTSAQFTAPSGTQLTGNSAEWVVERPGVGGGLATLTNYTTIPWYDSQVTVPNSKGGTTEYSPGKGGAGSTVYSITMHDDNNAGISKAYTSPNNKLTYVDPTQASDTLDGTSLWFFNFGSSQ